MEKASLLDKIFDKKWTPFLILIGIGLVLYFQVLFFGFTYLDDNNLILDNAGFLSQLSNLFTSFQIDVFHLFNHSAFYYRPILTISLILDYQLSGPHPFMYHFTNLVLHLLASCLVFLFLKKLNYRKELSLLFAMIFLAHPALVQAVAWIPGRNDSLATVFVLAAFIFLVQYLKDNKLKYFVWHLIFLALAVFTKEIALFFLLPAIFYFYFLNQRRNLKIRRGWWLLSWISIAGLWFLARSFALQGLGSLGFKAMLQSVYLNFPGLIQMLGKIFFPFNLSVLPIIQDTTFVYGLVAVLLSAGLLLWTKNKRWPYIFFGLSWFLIFLLPAFIRPNPAGVADFIEHRLYLPIIGFFIFLLETDLLKKLNFKRVYHLILLGLVLITLCVLTVRHSRNFSNRSAFWQNAVENSPHYPLANRNLGAMYYLDGKLDQAELEFKKALALNPSEEMAHNNLGLVYENRGQFDKSEAEYLEEIKINPFYDNAYYNLGILYYREGKYDQAEQAWRKVLSLNPNFLKAIYNLIDLYLEQKKYVEAKSYVWTLSNLGYPLPPELLKVLNN